MTEPTEAMAEAARKAYRDGARRLPFRELIRLMLTAAMEAAPPDGFGKLREANVRRQSEWDRDGKVTLSYRGNELAGEVGEACNVVKKIERARLGIRGSRDTVEHLAEELADVIICADLIAAAEGIDLWDAVQSKFDATSEKNNLVTRLGVSQ